MKKDNANVPAQRAKAGRSDSSAGKETSALDTWVLTPLRHAAKLVGEFHAYIVLAVAAFICLKLLPQKLGLPIWICAAFVSVPLILVFCFQTIPSFLEKRSRDRLAQVSGVGEAGYFQLAPRQNEESFHRADGKHVKVLSWLREPPARLLYLKGASGAGKSSLLSAWVIPKLVRDGVKVIRLRGYQDPAKALETELRRLGEGRGGCRVVEADLNVLLEEACDRVRPARLLIIFDQFEEFLILQEVKERTRFSNFLSTEAGKPCAAVSILLVFREEYEEFIQELALPVPVTGENLQKVSVFTEAAARDFLLGSGLSFDEKVQSGVLREAAEVERTLGLIRPITVNLCGLVLSRFALGLPRQLRPGRMIRGFVYESIFQPQIAEVAPLLLPKLISGHVTKVPRSITDLADGTPLTPQQVQGVMFRLGDPERAIVRPLDGEYTVWEISHDFLVPIIDSILAQWRAPRWKSLRQRIPVIATIALVLFVFALPRVLPDPISDLSKRGWTIHPHWESRASERTLIFDLGCSNCTTEDIEGSTRDMRRLHGELAVTLGNIATFDLGHFGGWAKLNVGTLKISGSKLLDISAVSKLSRLRSLSLSDSGGVSDAQLRDLPASLTTLDLGRTGVTDASIKNLPRGLSILNLGSTKVTGVGFRDLPPGLASLNLEFTGVTDEYLADLPRSLQHLGLGYTRVTDAGISKLPQGITSLDLDGTGVTDAVIKEISRSVQVIDLHSTKVSRFGLSRLPAGVHNESFRPAPPTGLYVVVVPSH